MNARQSAAMDSVATLEKRGAESGARKSRASSASSASAGSWRKVFACCLKAEDDDVQVLDYEHASLTDVPAEVFAHERTLEVLRLDCNQITDLPRPLFHCHGLKELYLSDNEIAQLPPALASLIHLQVTSSSSLLTGTAHCLVSLSLGAGRVEKRSIRDPRCYQRLEGTRNARPQRQPARCVNKTITGECVCLLRVVALLSLGAFVSNVPYSDWLCR